MNEIEDYSNCPNCNKNVLMEDTGQCEKCGKDICNFCENQGLCDECYEEYEKSH